MGFTELNVIIPCYNEESSIFNTIMTVDKILSSEGISFRIIVVNDGSTDNSAAEIEKAGDKVHLISVKPNMGYGHAIKKGLQAVQSGWIAIIDADLTYRPEDLITLWQNRENSDMIVGSRTGKNVQVPLLRRPMKYFLTKFASWLVDCTIPDLNSGIRIFKKEDALRFFRLYPNGFSFTTTITMSYLSSGLNVLFLPIDYQKREGKSKIRPIHDSYQFLLLLIKLSVYYNPLRVFLPISLFTFILSIISLVYDIFYIQNIGDKSVLLIMVSILVFLLGLLADLIIKRTSE